MTGVYLFNILKEVISCQLAPIFRCYVKVGNIVYSHGYDNLPKTKDYPFCMQIDRLYGDEWKPIYIDGSHNLNEEAYFRKNAFDLIYAGIHNFANVEEIVRKQTIL
jgi:hypothetical protein